MEELEIHSRSYLLRWVNVSGGHSISWTLQPRKRTINFGIFKHPGHGAHISPSLPSSSSLSDTVPKGEDDEDPKRRRQASSTSNHETTTSSVVDKMQKLGMKSVAWTGKCEADRVSTGQYDVPAGESGMYGLLFDNTASKQVSKTVTFVLMTFPTNAPPKSGHRVPFAQAAPVRSPSMGTTTFKKSPKLAPLSDSSDSLHKDLDNSKVMLAGPRPKSGHAMASITSLGGSFYTGVLSKKRRKRNQGYARRFFSLDFTSSTLSYYKSRNSSALRGAIPLSLAAVGANEKSRTISVDSGAEIWLLKAHSQQDFEGWRDALERASQERPSVHTTPRRGEANGLVRSQPDPAEDREWRAVEGLVGRVAGITDAVRRMAKDSDPKYHPTGGTTSNASSPAETIGSEEYFQPSDKPEKPSFWRRKSSSQNVPSANTARGASSSHRLAPPSPVPSGAPTHVAKTRSPSRQPGPSDSGIHDHCMAVLRDLDAVVASFSSLIAESRQRRTPALSHAASSRLSIDSTRSDEFFDAQDGEMGARDGAISPLLQIGRDNEGEDEGPDAFNDAASINSASTISNADAADMVDNNLWPTRPKSLHPLPHDPVKRRDTIPAAKGAPPSLVSFLRKNVGKDLSTIAMPVTANEPLSLLQRSAEPMEYASLLDAAAKEKADPSKRMLYVTAFAISALASSRARERAVRKPFNPLLGETFELIREDLGFRFVSEKVSHRPVRIASQADGGLHVSSSGSAAWTYAHSPAPSQKFWGKSAELITAGRVRVCLHESKECYAWTPANCFLRNIIAGEKYMEPAGSMTVTEETSGRRALVTFKSGGMFSGRSEDVTALLYDDQGAQLPLGLVGKWTTQLSVTELGQEGETIWRAGGLVNGAPARFGLTVFATSLNEVTALEEGALPPTDSRCRPDQRAYEQGDVDEAERLKVRLEEGQRRRRGEMEAEGEEWTPRWFEKVGAEDEGGEVWRLKGPEGDYWDVREAVKGFKGGRWDGVRDVFEV